MKRIKSINWYLKKYWWKYVLTIILSILIIYCDIKKPEIIGEAVDEDLVDTIFREFCMGK